MPTSATGTSIPDFPARVDGAAGPAAGFTLAEVLVVLVVVSIVAGVIGLSTGLLPKRASDHLAAFAHRFATLRDHARISGRSVGIGFSDRSYRIFDRIDGHWSPRAGGTGRLPALSGLQIDGRDVAFDASLGLSPERPTVFVLPTGLVTPLRITPADPALPSLTLAATGAIERDGTR